MYCFSRRTRRRARPSRSRNFRLVPGWRSTRSRPSNDSEGFRCPAGLEALRADGDAPDGPVGDRLHPLHVGLPDFPGPVIGVGNVVPEIGTLAGDRAPRHVILRNKNRKLISRFMSGKQDQIRLGPRRKNTGVRMALVAMILLLAAGTAIPYLLARGLPPPSGSAADAILVLTGGESRIAQGFRAWKEGRGRDLFILGAGRDAKLANILPAGTEISPSDLPRAPAGGGPQTPRKKAFPAKSAVVSRAYKKVILVTSDYHVP